MRLYDEHTVSNNMIADILSTIECDRDVEEEVLSQMIAEEKPSRENIERCLAHLKEELTKPDLPIPEVTCDLEIEVDLLSG